MSINFKNIPSNIRVPLFYAEVDPSRANSGQLNQRALIIGQMQSSGTATAGVPVISQGPIADQAAFGSNSMLAQMIKQYRANDNFGELWILPLADDGAGVQASGSIAFTGPATAAGTLSLYIGGIRVQQAVTSGMTAAQLATALVATITAATDLQLTVTAAVNGSITSQVDVTAIHKGATGNDIDLRVNYLGAAGGEALPPGIGVTITAMASGTTNPVLTTPLANLSDAPFDFIVFPYTDSTSLDAMKNFMGDTAGRWAWNRKVYGHAFSAYRGSYASLASFGVGRNDQHMSIMGYYDSPTPPWLWAAAYAAQAAISVRADAGLPLHTLPLIGVLAPPIASRFKIDERNTLLFDGISTFSVQQDGTCLIEGAITTYQVNAYGQPDNSYLVLVRLYTLMYCLRFMETRITTKFARVKLAADGTRFGPGSNTVTPAIIKAELIAAYLELEDLGLVQEHDRFIAGLIVQKSSTDPNRVDVLWDGVLINQLDIFALLAQFRTM